MNYPKTDFTIHFFQQDFDKNNEDIEEIKKIFYQKEKESESENKIKDEIYTGLKNDIGYKKQINLNES